MLKRSIYIILTVFLFGTSAFTELPDHLSFDLNVPKEGTLSLEFYKKSLRNPGMVIKEWTQAGGYADMDLSDYPDVRTFRGRIVGGDPSIRLFMSVNDQNVAKIEALRDKAKVWAYDAADLSAILPNANTNAFVHTNALRQLDDPGPPAAASGEAGVDYMATPAVIDFVSTNQLQQLPMGLEVRYKYIKKAGGLTNYIAALEGVMNWYDYFLIRDGKVSVSITLVVVRADDDESADGSTPYPKGYSHSPGVKSEWLNNLKEHKDIWSQVYAGGSADAVGSIADAKKAAAAGGTYHELTHNWGAGHAQYGFDSQHSGSGITSINIEKMLARRNEIVMDAENNALSPLLGTYEGPVHTFTHFDAAITPINTPVNIPVLNNDYDSGDLEFTIDSFTTNTFQGGTVERLSGNVLRYTPPNGFTGKETLVYEVINQAGMRSKDMVSVEVVNHGLTLHYPLDDVAGTVMADLSGNNHEGALLSGTAAELSIPGIKGRGMIADHGIILDPARSLPVSIPIRTIDYRGTDYPFDYTMGTGNHFDPMSGDYSLMFWVKLQREVNESVLVLADKRWNSKSLFGFQIVMQGDLLIAEVKEFGGETVRKSTVWSNEPLEGGRWYHVAMVIDRTHSKWKFRNQVRLYVDGELSDSPPISLDRGSFIVNHRQPLKLGNMALGQLAYDDVKLYTQALTKKEIAAELAGAIYPVVNPEPAMGAVRVDTDAALLAWDAGIEAGLTYQVYFGDDKAAVRAATATTTVDEFKGQQETLNYQLGPLAEGTAYFWRVDKVLQDGTVITGDLWNFYTVADRSHLLNGLTSWWGFNERTGAKIYDSIQGRSAVIADTTTISRKPGIFGNSLLFPRDPEPSQVSNNKISLGSGLVPSGDLSVSFWARRPDKDQTSVLILGSTYRFAVGKYPYLYLRGFKGSQGRITNRVEPQGDGPIISYAWHHLLFSRKGNIFTIYVDGKLVRTERIEYELPAIDVNGEARIGGTLTGAVDEIMIWDRAITAVDRDLLFAAFRDEIKISSWEDLADGQLATLTGLPTYPDQPDEISQGSVFQKYSTVGDHYGFLMEAAFIPPSDGTYRLQTSTSTGSGQLWMNLAGPATDGSERIGNSKDLNLTADTNYYLKGIFAVGDRKGEKASFSAKVIDPHGENHLLAYPYVRSIERAEASNTAPLALINPIVYNLSAESTKLFSIHLSGYMVDPDPWEQLTYNKESGPDWVTVSEDGVLSVDPSGQPAGSTNIQVRIRDRANAEEFVWVHINLNPNAAPVWQDDITLTVMHGIFAIINLSEYVTDPDAARGDLLTMRLVEGGSSKIFMKNDHTLQVRGGQSVITKELLIAATDSMGASSTGRVELIVRDPILTIHSPVDEGALEPAQGSHSYSYKSLVAASAEEITLDGVRNYVPTGYAITGSVTTNAPDAEVSFTIIQDTQLTWFWTTNYKVRVQSSDNGHITPEPEWVKAGADSTISAQADTYYHFEQWNDGYGTVNPLKLKVTGPVMVGAVFAENIVINGTPEWWLERYHLGMSAADAMKDPDADGQKNWEEYIAGTDPTNTFSVLKGTIKGIQEDSLEFSWKTELGRTYTILTTETLADDWKPLQSKISGSGATNRVDFPVEGNVNFIKIQAVKD